MFPRSSNTTARPLLTYPVILVLFIIILTSCSGSQSGPIQVPCSTSGLIDAINDANADPSLTELILESDCIIEFTDQDNFFQGSGGTALPLITSAIRISGNNARLIRGDVQNKFRIFSITSAGSLRLENVIIKNGYAEAQGSKPDGGGAIANYGGVLTLHNSALNLNFGDHGGAIFNTGSLIVEANTRFRRNNSHQGGAIYNGSSAGIPISITDATFYKNTADGLDLGLGGAIYNAGTDGAGMNISDSEFTENTASGSGGAIYTADPDAPMQIYHSSFYDNGVSKDGGAIYQEKGTVHLTLTMLIHNRAWVSSGSCGGNHEYDQRGGAIYVDHGTLEVNQSSFNNNSAEYAGGTIYNFRGTVSITGSSLANGKTNDSQTSACSNISSYGGCIYNTRSLTIENSSILNCSSEYGGGLMHGLTNVVPVTATLINVSLIGNQAIIAGGNISTFSNLDLNFVTLHLGKADVGRSIFVGGGYTRVKDSIFDINLTENDNNCVIDDGLFSVFGENIDRTSTCPNFSIREDPDLIYSGNDQYYYLNDYSPARDKSDCLTLLGSTVQTDQIGHNRPPPEEVQCDLGAIEMEELPSPPPPEPEIMPRLYAPENLTCREGDSTEYPAAGYLMAGEAADVIGQNSQGTWLVINNPDWEGICWLYRDTVDLEGNLDTTAVLIAPPLIQLEEEDSKDSSPACKDTLGPEECKKAGGFYVKQTFPNYCKCP